MLPPLREITDIICPLCSDNNIVFCDGCTELQLSWLCLAGPEHCLLVLKGWRILCVSRKHFRCSCNSGAGCLVCIDITCTSEMLADCPSGSTGFCLEVTMEPGGVTELFEAAVA